MPEVSVPPHRILFVFGTRPEAIKLAPLIECFCQKPDRWEVSVCVTAQHRSMLDQVLEFFEIQPDDDLAVMEPGQTPLGVAARCLTRLETVIQKRQPELLVVQGDTTTVLAAALAGAYSKVPVVHVEAGLRSGRRDSPFPEEINRVATGHLATYHFAPTDAARRHLLREGIERGVYVVGNTVIDALHSGIRRLGHRWTEFEARDFAFLRGAGRVLLVTGHRRESFGPPFEAICRALRRLALEFEDLLIVYPVHFNPQVREPVHRILGGIPRVHLIEPLDYPRFIGLMNRATLIMTDSGGVQEEAPALGKPVLVMREVTERQEGIDAGTARLVGTDEGRMVAEARRLLTDDAAYQAMAKAVNPYGDGRACVRIEAILAAELGMAELGADGFEFEPALADDFGETP